MLIDNMLILLLILYFFSALTIISWHTFLKVQTIIFFLIIMLLSCSPIYLFMHSVLHANWIRNRCRSNDNFLSLANFFVHFFRQKLWRILWAQLLSWLEHPESLDSFLLLLLPETDLSPAPPAGSSPVEQAECDCRRFSWTWIF